MEYILLAVIVDLILDLNEFKFKEKFIDSRYQWSIFYWQLLLI